MLRSTRERSIQAIVFALGANVLAMPIIYWASGQSILQSTLLTLSLSIVLAPWVFLHNYVFDLIELKRSGRIASDRSTKCRIIHALSLEVSSIPISVLVIVVLTNLAFGQALIADIVPVHLCVSYGLLFHLAVDHFWPVRERQDRGPLDLQIHEGYRQRLSEKTMVATLFKDNTK